MPPSFAVWWGRPTAYPVTSPGVTVLYRLRTRRRIRQAGEEFLFRACSGRRGGHLTAQGHPGRLAHLRRAACSVSARAGRRAAVRSAGAVDRSPNRASASWQASRTR